MKLLSATLLAATIGCGHSDPGSSVAHGGSAGSGENGGGASAGAGTGGASAGTGGASAGTSGAAPIGGNAGSAGSAGASGAWACSTDGDVCRCLAAPTSNGSTCGDFSCCALIPAGYRYPDGGVEAETVCRCRSTSGTNPACGTLEDPDWNRKSRCPWP